MKQRVLILTDEKSPGGIKWEKIGTLVHELPHLYQTVKERRTDLIIVDESHIGVTQAIAARIRRYNGLTEIWSLTNEPERSREADDAIDGFLPVQLGEKGIVDKVKQILVEKDRLSRFGMVGRSQSMKAIGGMIERIARTDISVLIVGPSGSGKELVAHAIHNESARASKPFVAVNCGALSEGVLESELFGHEKGAFTGSVARREGLFSKADGGTIFLDEIGETKPEMQVKLLRVLEDGTYYPVGSSIPLKADVRAVAATNRDLSEAIAEKEFREDLYFRVGAVKIVLPPLFERRIDIQPLLQAFLSVEGDPQISDSALELLTRYDWPGNVRQLKNFADRVRALEPEGLIEVDDVKRFLAEQQSDSKHLPVSTGLSVEQAGQELIYRAILSLGNEVRMLRDLIVSNLPTGPSVQTSDPIESDESGSTMEDMEESLIRQVLAETNGNRRETAWKLGIGERTLYRKLKKYNLN